MKIVLSPVGAPTQKLNFFLPHKNIERLCFVVYLNFNYERNFEMTEKIKLTKEQSNGLEVIKKLYSIDNVLKTHAKADKGAWIGVAEGVNDLSLSDLATALIVGYEVEMTPGEIIKAEYQKAADERKKSEDDYRIQYLGGYQYGVQETLRVLEIIVEGVNDNETF